MSARDVFFVQSPPRRGGVDATARSGDVDGVVRPAATFRRTSIEASPYRARAWRHPGLRLASLGAFRSCARRGIENVPYGIRTRAAALKGLCPRPG